MRRLADLLAEIPFLEVQLRVVQDSAGPHRIRNVGMLIASLHRRLDALEWRLRVQARAEGEDERATMSEIRRRLAALAERHPSYHGTERRRPARSPDGESVPF